VALHGFTQTGRSWHRFASAAERAGTELLAPDLPGHASAGHERPADLAGAAALVAARVFPALAGRPARWIGYSLGGRVLLHLALVRPDLVDSLVLVSTTAGIDDDHEREARCRDDNALADRIEEIGTDAFLDEWMTQPLFASLTVDPDDVADRRRNTAAGLASSLRCCGTGTQAPLWSRLPELTMPTLVVTGALDAKFTALGHRLVAALPSASHFQLDGAGHACHLERPAEFAKLLGWPSTA
jgi:2-succinyl-6-hydroxy-2,4-cyclohexadiene-1-carboxylate synthase